MRFCKAIGQNLYVLLGIMLLISAVSSCTENGGINIFSIDDDVELGMQLRDQVLMDTSYTVMDRTQYSSAYSYLDGIVNDILNSGEIAHKEKFSWEVYLIDDAETLNAFAAPGGYIFVYSGLIKFLEVKDDFVGVMGHEMAHADRRHSTQQLTKQYGVGILLSTLSGSDPGILSQILSSLVGLKFSRSHEAEADEYSVKYLCNTDYAANGAASFFEKLVNEGTTGPPTFLSTHPSPEDRVEEINLLAKSLGCDTTFDSNKSEWKTFQDMLP